MTFNQPTALLHLPNLPFLPTNEYPRQDHLYLAPQPQPKQYQQNLQQPLVQFLPSNLPSQTQPAFCICQACQPPVQNTFISQTQSAPSMLLHAPLIRPTPSTFSWPTNVQAPFSQNPVTVPTFHPAPQQPQIMSVQKTSNFQTESAPSMPLQASLIRPGPLTFPLSTNTPAPFSQNPYPVNVPTFHPAPLQPQFMPVQSTQPTPLQSSQYMPTPPSSWIVVPTQLYPPSTQLYPPPLLPNSISAPPYSLPVTTFSFQSYPTDLFHQPPPPPPLWTFPPPTATLSSSAPLTPFTMTTSTPVEPPLPPPPSLLQQSHPSDLSNTTESTPLWSLLLDVVHTQLKELGVRHKDQQKTLQKIQNQITDYDFNQTIQEMSTEIGENLEKGKKVQQELDDWKREHYLEPIQLDQVSKYFVQDKDITKATATTKTIVKIKRDRKSRLSSWREERKKKKQAVDENSKEVKVWMLMQDFRATHGKKKNNGTCVSSGSSSDKSNGVGGIEVDNHRKVYKKAKDLIRWNSSSLSVSLMAAD